MPISDILRINKSHIYRYFYRKNKSGYIFGCIMGYIIFRLKWLYLEYKILTKGGCHVQN